MHGEVQCLGRPRLPDRALAIKEERADLVKHHLWVLWTDYFRPEHLEKYPELHDLFWKTTKTAGEAKKTNDVAVANVFSMGSPRSTASSGRPRSSRERPVTGRAGDGQSCWPQLRMSGDSARRSSSMGAPHVSADAVGPIVQSGQRPIDLVQRGLGVGQHPLVLALHGLEGIGPGRPSCRCRKSRRGQPPVT